MRIFVGSANQKLLVASGVSAAVFKGAAFVLIDRDVVLLRPRVEDFGIEAVHAVNCQ